MVRVPQVLQKILPRRRWGKGVVGNSLVHARVHGWGIAPARVDIGRTIYLLRRTYRGTCAKARHHFPTLPFEHRKIIPHHTRLLLFISSASPTVKPLLWCKQVQFVLTCRRLHANHCRRYQGRRTPSRGLWPGPRLMLWHPRRVPAATAAQTVQAGTAMGRPERRSNPPDMRRERIQATLGRLSPIPRGFLISRPGEGNHSPS
jgi:hypothetical protein